MPNIISSSSSAKDLEKKTKTTLDRSTDLRRPGDTNSLAASVQADGTSVRGQPTRLERLAKRIPGLGIWMALCASLFFGTTGMLVKMTHSVHGIQLAVFRATIQLIVYVVIIWLRRVPIWPAHRGELWPIAGRALLSGISITFYYTSLKQIPLGDATTIKFSLPIWTLIIGYLLLGEPCSLVKLVAVVSSIAGVILIAKPDECVQLFDQLVAAAASSSSSSPPSYSGDIVPLTSSVNSTGQQLQLLLLELAEDDAGQSELATHGLHHNVTSLAMAAAAGPQGALTQEMSISGSQVDTSIGQQHQQLAGSLMALTSSVALAIALIFLRLCKRTPAEVIILWCSLVAIAFGSISLVFMDEWRLPNNAPDCLYILLNGLCASAGSWLLTSALKIEQSGMIALARTFDIQVAFLYSALLLDETIRPTSIIGSVLVSSGVLVTMVPKWFGCGRGDSSSDQEATSK